MSVVRSYRRQDSAACILATIWQLELQHRTFFLCVKVELQERCVSRLSVAFANVLATIRGQPTGPSPLDKSFRSCLRVGTSGPFCARIEFRRGTGRAIVCLNAGPGSLLGLPGLIANEPYTLTAMARKGSAVRFGNLLSPRLTRLTAAL